MRQKKHNALCHSFISYRVAWLWENVGKNVYDFLVDKLLAHTIYGLLIL